MESQLIQITSGRGPAECCYAVSRLAPLLQREAEKRGLKIAILEKITGVDNKGYKSIMLSIEGTDVSDFISAWQGSIQWISESPFRKGYNRKNWFLGISRFDQLETMSLNNQDYKVELMRASGPGGQHVNKTESAVRITHLPTGISAIAQEQRSQRMNRQLAFARLQIKLDEQKEASKALLQQSCWDKHNQLQRGNPVRVYIGKEFRLKPGA